METPLPEAPATFKPVPAAILDRIALNLRRLRGAMDADTALAALFLLYSEARDANKWIDRHREPAAPQEGDEV